ncbi:type III secretion apparatus protein OrgA/MxiK [Yokenella regensburgei]|uniref:type III secretion apparatus protein OrgA/MxiK n=1 Tax=Yokenella regensburgei TaxID=158877 RepID=UPI00143314AC|nr:type III secretion apparatus protein OrgA/MxiK [Yokenella regensburgei]QIU92599.1 type III secretion apparatus protein OrgA/MxiK [Yokenella regensburgei]
MIETLFSAELQRVLLNPMSYLNPLRARILPHLVIGSAAQAVVNELLIVAFQLETSSIYSSPMVRQWVKHWDRLPQVAYLIGCHNQRAELAREGALLRLPAWARSFITISHPTRISSRNIVFSHNMLMRIGYAQLLVCGRQLPKPLKQRFPLLFSPEVDSVVPQTAADPLIFALALQHAQSYPNISPVDSR